MLQIGIFTGYFPYEVKEVVRRIRQHGFNTVQLDLDFRDGDFSTDALTPSLARAVAGEFRKNDLPICCISGYCNLVHPDKETRGVLIERLKRIIALARDFGSPYVISETGTFNQESDWAPHPKNKTEEGYEICRDIIADLAETARAYGATFLLETYVNNVIGSVQETLRLFADIDSPALGLLMDPTNYFEDHNIGDIDGELNRIFNALDDKIRIAHAKDVKWSADTSEKHADIDAVESHTFRGVGHIELPAPGLGDLNYPLYLERLARKHPNIPLIIEHLEEADVPRAKQFISEVLSEVGC